ncbi:hypothetical protein CDEST_02123 [Colletotrichum destructivum]|uniref:Uncharacterized protein n=1 Tax=Colletotrichum destructivum TaxID=34406 RepID=A0AAX4I230_9PEZI|nr:hypothetical protein CDEST_02123 [Colletotrichum destructivum]
MVERQIPPTKTTQLVTPQQPVQTQLVCKNEITDCDVNTKAELPGTVEVPVKPLCAAGTPVVHSKPPVTETERAAADSASPRPGLLALVKTFFWKIKDSLADIHHGSAAMTLSAQPNVTSPSQGPQSKHDNAILGMAKTAVDSSCVATRAHVDATTFADQPQERRVLDQASVPVKLIKEDTPATAREPHLRLAVTTSLEYHEQKLRWQSVQHDCFAMMEGMV